jgi:hypothetical protein
VLRDLGFGELVGDTLLLCCCRTGKHSRFLVSFPPLWMIGHLKLHTVGDVDLSHFLGIDFGCAGYETEFDINADGWYGLGMRRFAQGCL